MEQEKGGVQSVARIFAIIELLAAHPRQMGRFFEDEAARRPVEAAFQPGQGEVQGIVQVLFEAVEAVAHLLPSADHQLGGGGGGRNPQIRREVTDREVDFMADRADHRH